MDNCKPSRQKYWKECNDSEKIERMRMEVKNLQGTVNRMNKIVEHLKNHHHHPQAGIVLVRLPEAEYRFGGVIGTSDEVVF